MNFKTENVNTVAEALINEYNAHVESKEKKIGTELLKITPLELQKLLYYVDGISLSVYEIPAFSNNFLAWEYGPVVQEIYDKYKNYGKEEIILEKTNIKISRGLRAIIRKVIEGYGQFTGGQLIELTHEETPWKTTVKNDVINKEKIKNYFKKIYTEE